jgi:hypothetical protein
LLYEHRVIGFRAIIDKPYFSKKSCGTQSKIILQDNDKIVTKNVEVDEGFNKFFDLKRIWNPIDFQGQRSRSQGLIFRRGDTPRFALPLLFL